MVEIDRFESTSALLVTSRILEWIDQTGRDVVISWDGARGLWVARLYRPMTEQEERRAFYEQKGKKND